MQRHEWLSSLVGGLGGALLSGAIAWFFVPQAGLWVSILSGTVIGLVGGALGQNLIEGLVLAMMCAVLLTGILIIGLPAPWMTELGVGLLIGSGFGWMSHGLANYWSR